MKTLVYSLFGIFIGFYGNAKEVQQEKHAHISISTSGFDHLSINAKNTEISIQVWDKEELSVEADFYYRGEENHSKIQEFMAAFEKNVKAGITTVEREIKLNTYRAVPSKTKIGWAIFGVDLAFSEDEVKLVYKLKVPASLFMKIVHSYKDLRVIGAISKIDIEQYSGRLSLGEVKEAKLNLKYGEAVISDLNKADIYIHEQKISGDHWGDIHLNSKYSNLRVRNINQLNGEGYETSYRVFRLTNLGGNYKYSNFDIETMDEANIYSHETRLESDNIKLLKLMNSKYCNYRITSLEKLDITQSFEDEYHLKEVKNVSSTSSKYCNFKIETLRGNYSLSAHETRVAIGQIASLTGKLAIDGKYLNISLGLGEHAYKLESTLQYGNLQYHNSLQGNFTEKNSLTKANLNTPNLGKDFYSITVNGFEVQLKLQ